MEEIIRQGQQAVSEPTGQISSMPEVNDFYSGAIDALTLDPAAQASQVMSSEQARVNEENQRIAEANRLRELQAQQQKLKDKLDPGKYQIRTREDESTQILDPDGEEVSISDYASIAGVSPLDILKGSNHPLERQFGTEYQKMQDVVDAISNGDTGFLEELKANDPNRFRIIENASNKGELSNEETIKNLLEAFRSYYPEFYGQEGENMPAGQSRFPSAAATDEFLPMRETLGGQPEVEEPSEARGMLTNAFNTMSGPALQAQSALTRASGPAGAIASEGIDLLRQANQRRIDSGVSSAINPWEIGADARKRFGDIKDRYSSLLRR